MASGMMPVLKRPALVDAKTGLPVYRQLTGATSYPQMATINAMQQIQPQPFISFPSKTAAHRCMLIRTEFSIITYVDPVGRRG